MSLWRTRVELSLGTLLVCTLIVSWNWAQRYGIVQFYITHPTQSASTEDAQSLVEVPHQPWQPHSSHPSAPAIQQPAWLGAVASPCCTLHTPGPCRQQRGAAAATHATAGQQETAGLAGPGQDASRQLGERFRLLMEPASPRFTRSCLTDWMSPLQVSTALLMPWRTLRQVCCRIYIANSL